jgi:hypothetical protein
MHTFVYIKTRLFHNNLKNPNGNWKPSSVSLGCCVEEFLILRVSGRIWDNKWQTKIWPSLAYLFWTLKCWTWYFRYSKCSRNRHWVDVLLCKTKPWEVVWGRGYINHLLYPSLPFIPHPGPAPLPPTITCFSPGYTPKRRPHSGLTSTQELCSAHLLVIKHYCIPCPLPGRTVDQFLCEDCFSFFLQNSLSCATFRLLLSSPLPTPSLTAAYIPLFGVYAWHTLCVLPRIAHPLSLYICPNLSLSASRLSFTNTVIHSHYKLALLITGPSALALLSTCRIVSVIAFQPWSVSSVPKTLSDQ